MNCIGFFPLSYYNRFQTSTLILQHIGAKHIGLDFLQCLMAFLAGKALLMLGVFSLFSVHAFINPVLNSDIFVLLNLW